MRNVQCVHFFANIFQSLNNFLYLCFCFGSLWGRLMALSANEKIWPQFSGRISTAAPTLLSPSSSSWPPSPSPSSSSPWWASYPLFADISRPLCNSWGDFTDSTSRSTNLSYLSSSSSSSYFHFGKSTYKYKRHSMAICYTIIILIYRHHTQPSSTSIT